MKEKTTVSRGHGMLRDMIGRFLKNKAAVLGLIIMLILIWCALFPSTIAPYGYDDQNYQIRLQAPGNGFLFGTDQYGRDIFSRVVYGARESLVIGVLSIMIACVLGTILGLLSGYYSGIVDNLIMRALDIILAIPNMMLAISIVAAFGRSKQNLILAIGIGAMGGFARTVRASVLTVREEDYIEVSKSIGGGTLRILLRHILPNCAAPIIVQICTGIGTSILGAAGMSFLGLGIAPPIPEWGTMLSDSRNFIAQSWHVVLFPGLAIMLTVFAFNLFGDGLRDALDPRLKN